MGQSIIYPHPKNFMGRLAILTIQENLCGYYQLWSKCVDAGIRIDSTTGHRVCCGCGRVTSLSGLMICDICEREFIDLSKYRNPKYEITCPECVKEYGLEDVV